MKKVVMIVDDSESVRKFVMFALRSRGCQVIAAKDGMHALELLAHKKVDLIITDLNMPNLDGFELVRAIRDDQELKALPIIILSSLDSEGEKKLGKELGANAYLIKPFDQKRIQYEVSKFIN